MKYKSNKLNILANVLMIIGFIMILIPLVYLISGHGVMSADISLIGIILGLIGIFIFRKINKN